MGQCMSRKAGTAIAVSAGGVHQRGMLHKHKKLKESPEDENNKITNVKRSNLTKGVATSFGFKRRPAGATSVAGNPTAARRLANPSTETIDRNGNEGEITTDTEPLTTNVVSSGRSTPHRLPPPKKEAAATKVSRFGFRQNNANRMNRVADINTAPPIEYGNNNLEAEKLEEAIRAKVEMQNKMLMGDSNKNRGVRKFTLQSNQLPRPQSIRVLETKTAKTLANNNKKSQPSGDESSSMTEDSGVGGDIQQLDRSPMFRRRIKPRTLEMVVTGNTFDVRDLDESQPIPKLPPLPSAFQRGNSGFVRERTMEYQKKIEFERIRRNSLTSSEASSHYEEEKTYRDKARNEKIPKTFLKPRIIDSSPPSSDDQMWSNAGEAMADDFSCSFSSSDESKDRDPPAIRTALQNLMASSFLNDEDKKLVENPDLGVERYLLEDETCPFDNFLYSYCESAPNHIISSKDVNEKQNVIPTSLLSPISEMRNVFLNIEDKRFAEVAVSSAGRSLLEHEISPIDSFPCSYSESTPNHKKSSSTNSKDVNEKQTLSTPGSPTNASNSLSLSDGRDDFLIDDEIADQPALVFDDTITNSEAMSHQSEATPTLIDNTPKPKRRELGNYEGSPMVLRNRKLLSSRTGSLDTLSPCESIASDDCIMDFESQSSGVEDVDRTDHSAQFCLDDVKVRNVEFKSSEIMRDWATLMSSCENSSKRLSRPSRLIRSRAGTPSSVPDSPRSVEGLRGKTSISQSPLRLSSRSSGTAGYDSDDSAIRVDRAQHCAMQQDVMGIKTMLLKLKRVLQEPAVEDFLPKSETRNPLENGFFNGFNSDCDKDSEDQDAINSEELANLRRQVLFLQGQLEDKDRTVQNLQEKMVRLVSECQNSHSAPASVSSQASTCNAATQTERLRPISAGPSLLQGSPTDVNPGSLVSASELSTRRSRGVSTTSPKPPNKLWRMPGEPPSPHRFTPGSSSPSSIPRRSCSKTRIPS